MVSKILLVPTDRQTNGHHILFTDVRIGQIFYLNNLVLIVLWYSDCREPSIIQVLIPEVFFGGRVILVIFWWEKRGEVKQPPVIILVFF